MRFGVCVGPDRGAIVKQAGFDYWEWSVSALLCPLENDEAFRKNLDQARTVDLPCEALNGFIPPAMPIVGPNVDFPALERYVETAMIRAQTAGIRRIVFGSGGARRIPEGFDHRQAWDQLVRFSAMVGEKATPTDVIVVVEPLNVKETNTLNTVADGARLVNELKAKGLRLLVDSYHWGLEPVPGVLGDFKEMFYHTHVATLPHRLAPGLESYDFVPFFRGLIAAGYDGRVSIEGRLLPEDRPDADSLPILAEALAVLRKSLADAS